MVTVFDFCFSRMEGVILDSGAPTTAGLFNSFFDFSGSVLEFVFDAGRKRFHEKSAKATRRVNKATIKIIKDKRFALTISAML